MNASFADTTLRGVSLFFLCYHNLQYVCTCAKNVIVFNPLECQHLERDAKTSITVTSFLQTWCVIQLIVHGTSSLFGILSSSSKFWWPELTWTLCCINIYHVAGIRGTSLWRPQELWCHLQFLWAGCFLLTHHQRNGNLFLLTTST